MMSGHRNWRCGAGLVLAVLPRRRSPLMRGRRGRRVPLLPRYCEMPHPVLLVSSQRLPNVLHSPSGFSNFKVSIRQPSSASAELGEWPAEWPTPHRQRAVLWQKNRATMCYGVTA